MKKYITILLSLFISLALYSQVLFNDTVVITANWQKGYEAIYEVVKSKIQYSNDQQELNTNQKFYIKLKVLDATKDNYTIEYGIDSVQFNLEQKNLELTNIINKILPKIKYVFITDIYGEFVELLNWEKTRDSIFNLFENSGIINELGVTDANEKEKIIQTLKNMYNSQEAVESMLAKDILFLFSFYGYQYPINQTVYFESFYKIPIGEASVLGNGQIKLISTNAEENMIEVFQTIDLDEKDVKKAIYSYIEKMTKELDLDKESIKEMKKINYMIHDSTHIKFDLNSGWFIDGYFKRNSLINQEKKLQRIDIISYKKN